MLVSEACVLGPWALVPGHINPIEVEILRRVGDCTKSIKRRLLVKQGSQRDLNRPKNSNDLRRQ